ncbi:MAG: response regulator [Candidatus Melainabacteria bacterium]|nr:MAG: response regulator [Candidatus Melainabacteria bacterium]
MPKLNGIEFLTKVKALYDDISLILLTGYADKENAIKAINELGIYKYIEKPWDNDNLILNIKNAIERSELISNLKIKFFELDKANKALEKYSQNLETIVDEKTKL